MNQNSHCIWINKWGLATCILNLYMGKNTPERKDYIMDRLVVPVEE